MSTFALAAAPGASAHSVPARHRSSAHGVVTHGLKVSRATVLRHSTRVQLAGRPAAHEDQPSRRTAYRSVVIQSIDISVHRILRRVDGVAATAITTVVDPLGRTITDATRHVTALPSTSTSEPKPPVKPVTSATTGDTTSSDRAALVPDARPVSAVDHSAVQPAASNPAPATPRPAARQPTTQSSPKTHAVPSTRTPGASAKPVPHERALGAFNSVALRSTTAMAILAGIGLLTVAAMAYLIAIGRRGRL